jgi:hypothetical protein
MNEILKWRVCRIIFINDTYLISYLRYSTHQQDSNHQWNLQKCALCCCRVNVTCMCERLLEGDNVECQFSYPNDIAIDNLNDRNILVMLIVWLHIVSNLTISYLSIIRKGYVSNMHWYQWEIYDSEWVWICQLTNSIITSKREREYSHGSVQLLRKAAVVSSKYMNCMIMNRNEIISLNMFTKFVNKNWRTNFLIL